ncbi:S1 family peptidase [Marinicella meishanensis]|uniref:S1 family peptidase n=1 Tax=Marinicella meishanensis TaxID=2873263 RepID=UPI001CBD8F66|nr:S1 family peptidase [Marinicella sp. NBU2979]
MKHLNTNSTLKSWGQQLVLGTRRSLLISLPLLSFAAWAGEDHAHEQARPALQAAAALAADTTLLAAERGVKVEAISEALAFQKSFSTWLEQTIERHPNQVARMWVSPAPKQAAHIQFVGRAPAIRAPKHVHVSDGAEFSFQEQDERAVQLSRLLRAQGQSNFMTYFDHQTGLIKLEMKTADRAKALTLDDLELLLSTAPKQLDQDDQSAAHGLRISDLDYEVVIGAGEIYDFDIARGGEWATDDGVQECTTGWAVSGPNGNGIITAAHCTGLNGIDHHYTTSDPSMTFRSQERGNGDVEYHTTSHTEVAEYFAREDEDREVNSIKWTFLMFPGQSVCEYGRSDNVRSCNHDVIANNVTATFTDGVTVNNLVRVTGDDSIGGDSGGPWSWANEAWGVHSGSNGSTSLFTPVQRAQSELNVTILTQ